MYLIFLLTVFVDSTFFLTFFFLGGGGVGMGDLCGKRSGIYVHVFNARMIIRTWHESLCWCYREKRAGTWCVSYL